MTQEAATLKAIQDWLDMKGILYIRVNPISPVAPGRWRKPRASQKGAPDLVMFLRDKTIAIEVKSTDGTLRPEQKTWQAKAKRISLPYHVVKSFGEFLGMLTIKI